MEKVHFDIETVLTENPEKKINVIITLKEDTNPDILQLKEYKILMDTIIQASASPVQIKSISKLEQIISVELDSEMEAF
jgi:hypothetical protein